MFVFFEAASPIQPTPAAPTTPQQPQTAQPTQPTSAATTTPTPQPTTQPAAEAATPQQPTAQPSNQPQSDRLSRLAKTVALVGGGIGLGALAHAAFAGGDHHDSGDATGGNHPPTSGAAALGVGGRHSVPETDDHPPVRAVESPGGRVINQTTNNYHYYGGNNHPQPDDSYQHNQPRVFRSHLPSSSLQPGHQSIMIGNGHPARYGGWGSSFPRYGWGRTPFDDIHPRVHRIPVPLGYGYRPWRW